MIRSLCFITILLWSVSCSSSKKAKAVSYKESIKTEFTNYLNALLEKDFEKSTEYLLPAFFDLIPKEELIAAMEAAFNNPEMKFDIEDPKILSVEDQQLIDEKYYALLTYSNIMRISFAPNPEEGEKEKSFRVGFLEKSLKGKFGEEHVEYKPEEDIFKVYSERKVAAISMDGQTDWKFVVLDKSQLLTLVELIPEEILDPLFKEDAN